MEGWMTYNVLKMFSHLKMEKMETTQKNKVHQEAVYIVCYENGLKHTKVFTKSQHSWKTYKSSLTYVCIDTIDKGKYLSVMSLQTQLSKISQIPARDLSEYCESTYQ